MNEFASRPNKTSKRRRSQRILLSIAISAEGQTSAGQKFTETTKIAVVNAHGAAILLRHAVSHGASLKITNTKTGETSMAIVVALPSTAEAGTEVGIELKPTLKIRKLLILLNEKNDKNTEFTQVRYTLGTRRFTLSLSKLRRHRSR